MKIKPVIFGWQINFPYSELFHRSSEKIIKTYDQNNGLSFKIIWEILEDNKNSLWIGTTNGLSKFNTVSKTFRNYYVEDGLVSDYFLVNYPQPGFDGIMYFRTRSGPHSIPSRQHQG